MGIFCKAVDLWMEGQCQKGNIVPLYMKEDLFRIFDFCFAQSEVVWKDRLKLRGGQVLLFLELNHFRYRAMRII